MSPQRAIAVMLLLAAPAGGEPVAGHVFLDANRNGRRDAGEKGLAGVPVTDGTSFALTGRDGRYHIDARPHPLLQQGKRPILTVSFPTGTWPTGGWFRRVERRGERAGEVDFALRPDRQTLPLVFVHATDPHVPRGGKERFAGFRDDMTQLARHVRFCILTGDCVDMADVHGPRRVKADWELFARQASDFPIPLFCTPGNHDAAGVNTFGGWDRNGPMYGYGYYWKLVGPLRWSFNCAGVPRKHRRIRHGQTIRGKFLDPAAKVRQVTVRLDNTPAKVTVRRGPVFSLFEAPADLTNVRPGLRRLTVTVSDGSSTWACQQKQIVSIR